MKTWPYVWEGLAREPPQPQTEFRISTIQSASGWDSHCCYMLYNAQWPLSVHSLLWASQYTHGGDSWQRGSVTCDNLTCDFSGFFFFKEFLLLTICLCVSVCGYEHRLQMHWETSDLLRSVITHSCEPPDGVLGTDLWFSIKAVWFLLLSHPFSPEFSILWWKITSMWSSLFPFQTIAYMSCSTACCKAKPCDSWLHRVRVTEVC